MIWLKPNNATTKQALQNINMLTDNPHTSFHIKIIITTDTMPYTIRTYIAKIQNLSSTRLELVKTRIHTLKYKTVATSKQPIFSSG